MTNELEKTFFDTFGIEPKWKSEQCDGWLRTTAVAYFTNLEEAKKFGIVFQEEPEYPEITDRILLELICILSEWRAYLHSSYTIKANNTLDLKQDVLKDFLELFKWYEFKKCEKGIKHQVRTLFEEG